MDTFRRARHRNVKTSEPAQKSRCRARTFSLFERPRETRHKRSVKCSYSFALVFVAAIHYTMLKNVARYLPQTRLWGLIYCQPSPHPALPRSSTQLVPGRSDLPDFPLPDKPGQLIGFVDAGHANDLCRRRSTTGYAFLLNYGVISYRSKTQSTTATSSTEAEFLAAVTAANLDTHKTVQLHSTKTICLPSIRSTTVSPLSLLVILTSNILPFKIGPKPRISPCDIFPVSSLFPMDLPKRFAGSYTLVMLIA